MTKPILLSAAIHVILFGALFLTIPIDEVAESIVETVNIRIINKSVYGRISEKARASSPSESNRGIRKTASQPQFQELTAAVSTSAVIQSAGYSQQNIEIPLIEISKPPQPAVNESVGPEVVEALDPLAGLETALTAAKVQGEGNPNPWSLSWANGSERGILSFPMINADEFPRDTERLLDVLIRIKVSPQGDVISAEVVPPGSGDIRIDRHMHNVALQLVLEPWPVDNGDQEGSLRLLFLEGGR